MGGPALLYVSALIKLLVDIVREGIKFCKEVSYEKETLGQLRITDKVSCGAWGCSEDNQAHAERGSDSQRNGETTHDNDLFAHCTTPQISARIDIGSCAGLNPAHGDPNQIKGVPYRGGLCRRYPRILSALVW